MKRSSSSKRTGGKRGGDFFRRHSRGAEGPLGRWVPCDMGPPTGPDASWYPSCGSLQRRELGVVRPSVFAQTVKQRRRDAACLSGDKLFAHKWVGGVNCLELDMTDTRYLLCGTVDCVICVYDVEVSTAIDEFTGNETHSPLLRIGKGDGTPTPARASVRRQRRALVPAGHRRFLHRQFRRHRGVVGHQPGRVSGVCWFQQRRGYE